MTNVGERRYSRAVFESMLNISSGPVLADHGPAWSKFVRIASDGAWVEEDLARGELAWSPACDLDRPDGPDPLSTASLPFPFSAKQLAAWMLHGVGFLLREDLGGWELGPDEDLLPAAGSRGREVRNALVEAFSAYREAEAAIGRLPEGASATEETQWRMTMVRALLQPGGAVEAVTRKRVRSTTEQQKTMILSALEEGGFDHRNLSPPDGLKCPAKEYVRKKLLNAGLTSSQINDRWKEMSVERTLRRRER